MADTLDTTEAPEPPAHRGRERTALVLAVSLAVVFAVAAAVLAVLAARDRGDPRVEEVRVAAGRFGETLVTYDFRDPEAHRDAVLELATGSFAEEYEAAFEQGLADVITEVEAVSTGFVKEVYVAEVDDGQAQAIVRSDVEIDGAVGPRTLFDVYVLLTLVHVGGTWKVDQVTDLTFGGTPGGAQGGGAVTTDTTAPGATSVP